MAPRTKKKVLWVDDQIKDLNVYVGALRDYGFEVHIAESCEQAIRLVEAKDIDLALVDILMPPPDGIEVLRRLYKIRPDVALAALSSYLYLDKYRQELRSLDFPVALIDKDLPPVVAPDFKVRFIDPIVMVAKEGVLRTIASQEEALKRDRELDPFSIPLGEFMEKSLLEKDQLTQRAKSLAAHAIDAAFQEGKIWVLLVGSPTQVRATASRPADIPNEEEIMEFARSQKRAPFQFFKPVLADDMWCPHGEEAALKDYPTVTLHIGDSIIDVHFDTGAPMTFFSYEELLRLNAIRPTTLFALASRGSQPYEAAALKTKVLIECQLSGETKKVDLTGQAVRDWLNAPYVRLCSGICQLPTDRLNVSGENKMCPRRVGLVGRNLVTENKLVLVLNGEKCRTGFSEVK